MPKPKRPVIFPERDHGYGDSPDVIGPPRVGPEIPAPCPNRGCAHLYLIEVTVRLPGGREGMGSYGGCAACPYASPMVTLVPQRTTADEAGKEGEE